MSELVSVEFNPAQVPSGGNHLRRYYGCTGETLDVFIRRARTAKSTHKDRLPVRFPLTAPNSKLRSEWRNNNPTDIHLIREEGLTIKGSDLFMVKRLPISCRERRSFPNILSSSAFQDLFEADFYFSIYSLEKFIWTLMALGDYFKFGWAWKREWTKGAAGDPKLRPLFVEARFYGIDSVISLYDRRNFDGIAIEIVLRPWPTEARRKEGIYLSRFRSDVYVASNHQEYIAYVDGIDLGRQPVASWSKTLIKRYGEAASAREVCANRRDLSGLEYKKNRGDKYRYEAMPSSQVQRSS